MFDFQQILTEVPQRALRIQLGCRVALLIMGFVLPNFLSETHKGLSGTVIDEVTAWWSDISPIGREAMLCNCLVGEH